jgi:hypothetical protein
MRPAGHERGEARGMKLGFSCLERQLVQFAGLGKGILFFLRFNDTISRTGSKRSKRLAANTVTTVRCWLPVTKIRKRGAESNIGSQG